MNTDAKIALAAGAVPSKPPPLGAGGGGGLAAPAAANNGSGTRSPPRGSLRSSASSSALSSMADAHAHGVVREIASRPLGLASCAKCTHFEHTFKSDKREADTQAQVAAQAQAHAQGAPQLSAEAAAAAAAVAAAEASRSQTIVFKIGSSSISTSDGRLSLNLVSSFVEMVADLQRAGHRVVIVTSGAVSVGCQRLGLKERPKNVVTKQAVAAVGQGRLMRLYDDLFSLLGQPIAQVLLSRENLAQEHHYLNALNTFKELLRLGVVPVVNENDTVAVQELRFGDNDTLSALVGSIIRADWLFLLTDVDALYTANPREDPNARPIRVVADVNTLAVDTGSSSPLSGQWGTGGMATKLQAASIATAAGVRTAVCSTERLGDIKRMLAGHCDVGTQFEPQPVVLAGRKKWIALGLVPVGAITIDAGAVASVAKKRSLFAAGITAVTGKFPANSAVRVLGPSGREIGRGLTLYSSREIAAVMGRHSHEYAEALGYNGPAAVVHRDNLALFMAALSPAASAADLTKLDKAASTSSVASSSPGAGAGANAAKPPLPTTGLITTIGTAGAGAGAAVSMPAPTPAAASALLSPPSGDAASPLALAAAAVSGGLISPAPDCSPEGTPVPAAPAARARAGGSPGAGRDIVIGRETPSEAMRVRASSSSSTSTARTDETDDDDLHHHHHVAGFRHPEDDEDGEGHTCKCDD